jgi:hypothetical protein
LPTKFPHGTRVGRADLDAEGFPQDLDAEGFPQDLDAECFLRISTPRASPSQSDPGVAAAAGLRDPAVVVLLSAASEPVDPGVAAPAGLPVGVGIGVAVGVAVGIGVGVMSAPSEPVDPGVLARAGLPDPAGVVAPLSAPSEPLDAELLPGAGLLATVVFVLLSPPSDDVVVPVGLLPAPLAALMAPAPAGPLMMGELAWLPWPFDPYCEREEWLRLPVAPASPPPRTLAPRWYADAPAEPFGDVAPGTKVPLPSPAPTPVDPLTATN